MEKTEIKRDILKYSLVVFTLVFAFLFWRSLDQSINLAGASTWLLPIAWFSLFFIAFALAIILIKERLIVEILSLASLFLSLLFLLNFWQALAIVLGVLIASLGLAKIRYDLKLNIKVSLWKSIRSGSAFLIFAASLAVTSFYYLSIKDASFQQLVPKFKIQGLTSTLTSQLLSAANPNFKNVDTNGMTVDDLILTTQKKQLGDAGLPALNSDSLNQVILAEGRQQMSSMTGLPLTGEEKVSDVISGVINKKIETYIAPDLLNGKAFPFIPAVMAFILFLTLVPLGSFLSVFWILLIQLVFFLLVKADIIGIAKIPSEVEVIE